MPSADIFQRATRTPCYFKLGVFQNQANKEKFVRASFDLVQLDDGLYVQPVTSAVPNGSSKVNSAVTVFAETGENFYKAQEEFFEDGTRVILGEHEMGDYKGNLSNWKECFKLGKI